MATSDHIKALFKAFTRKDNGLFIQAARELIGEEKQKGHALLAKDLERILSNGGLRSAAVSIPNDVPTDRERGLPLVHIERPELGWERVILSKDLDAILHNIVEEFRKREIFKSYGMNPKRKILFFGPPGCGKTITARVLAGVLDVPLLYVRFDSVVSSYLGETSANLRKVFDYAQRGYWVVLFDEFDAIGKGRDNPFEHGELKRVVNTLLQLMDGFRGDSILIAATNHEKLLDSAIWRRFDEICYFDIPSPRERRELIGRFLSGFRQKDIDVSKMSRWMSAMTGDDIERVCIDAVKTAILDSRQELRLSDVELAVKRQKKRMKSALARPTGGPTSEHGVDA